MLSVWHRIIRANPTKEGWCCYFRPNLARWLTKKTKSNCGCCSDATTETRTALSPSLVTGGITRAPDRASRSGRLCLRVHSIALAPTDTLAFFFFSLLRTQSTRAPRCFRKKKRSVAMATFGSAHETATPRVPSTCSLATLARQKMRGKAARRWTKNVR